VLPLINWSDDLENVDALTDLSADAVIATQLQAAFGKTPRIENLTDLVSDITLQWSVQGASIITLSLIDPWWNLLNYGFIKTDDAGLLEPLEINYPVGTDCFWWLVACNFSLQQDIGQANVTLTFEDKVVSQMREHGGPGEQKKASAGETTAQFIGSLVRAIPGARYWSPSMQQELAAGAFTGVGNTIYTGTLNPAVSPPSSSKQPGASPQRKNPTKKPGVTKVPGSVGSVAKGAGNAAAGAALLALGGVLNLLDPPPTAPEHGGTF
jgi:hypothetical protein